MSRHLVKLVHCILKHEGHHHIGDLGRQRGREETFGEEEGKKREETVSNSLLDGHMLNVVQCHFSTPL